MTEGRRVHFFLRFDHPSSRAVEFNPCICAALTETAMLISELTRFDSFYIFFHRTPRVLVCRQTDKEFRLS